MILFRWVYIQFDFNAEKIIIYYLVLGSSSCLRSHSGSDEDTVLPVARLVDERYTSGSATSEEYGIDGYTLRIFPSGIDYGALVSWCAET